MMKNAEVITEPQAHTEKAAEEAYLYDLTVAPLWREVFNGLLDEEIEVPATGDILDAGCGTGDYAIGLATVLGSRGTVVGVDPSEARLNLARAKATVKKLTNVSFRAGLVSATGLEGNRFDLAIGDVSMLTPDAGESVFGELRRVVRPGARVALIEATRGSFDEFHSIYWEALYRGGLLELSPALEKLATSRPTVAELEAIATDAGLRRVRAVTRKHRYDFADAATFMADPLIANYFLPGWLALVPGEQDRHRVREAMLAIIDESRNGIDFDLGIKATVVAGIK